MARGMTIGTIVLVLLFSATSSGNLAVNESKMNGLANPSDPIVTILLEHGVVIESNHTLDGRIVSVYGVESLDWKLLNKNGTLGNGSLLDSVLPVAGTASTYSWSFAFDPSGHLPCSCLLLIEATDQAGLIGRTTLSFFVGPTDDLGPSIVFPIGLPLQSASNPIDIPIALNAPSGNATVEWMVEVGVVPIEVCGEDGLSIGLPEGNWSSSDGMEMNGSLTLPATTWADGWIVVYARASDEVGRESWTACSTIGIDSTPPVVVLEGADYWIESEDLAIFDGSASTDLFWGRDGLIHVWSIEKMDGSSSTTTISGSDRDSHGFSLSESGIHRITLTVSDRAGHSNTTSIDVTVVNAPPVASFSIDGIKAIDGEMFRLADSGYWVLDASPSNDTENDEVTLQYLWTLDGEDLMTGKIRDLMRPADDGESHQLTLTVTDDDGSEDSLTIEFGIAGTSSDPARSVDAPLMVISALLIIVIITAGIVLRMSGGWPRQTTIRSWDDRETPPDSG